MISMRLLQVVTLLLAAVCAHAQLRKVESSFQKGKYEQCIQYCKQAKPGRDKQEFQQIKIYQCQSLLCLYQKSPAKLSYLDQAIQIYKTGNFYKLPLAKETTVNVLKIVRSTTDSLHRLGNKSLTQKYLKIQAGQLHDTTALYAMYFPLPAKKSAPTVVPTVKEKELPQRISRKELLLYAEQFLTVPYKWAGEDSSGFDCSGLVVKVFRQFGYRMNHGAKDQSELGEAVARDQLKQGDLVFFGKRYDTGRCKIDHVAIVYEVNDTQLTVIHSTSKGVNIQELKPGDYWGKKILFYKNLVDHFSIPSTNRL